MSAVSRYERWNTLIELVAAGGHLSVSEAARSLGVSEATIRRDLDWQHMFGASVVATIPVFILFALIEGRVGGGLTAGSIK